MIFRIKAKRRDEKKVAGQFRAPPPGTAQAGGKKTSKTISNLVPSSPTTAMKYQQASTVRRNCKTTL